MGWRVSGGYTNNHSRDTKSESEVSSNLETSDTARSGAEASMYTCSTFVSTLLSSSRFF